MRRGTRFFAIVMIITILLCASVRATGFASISDVILSIWFFVWLAWRASIANDNEDEENEA